MKRSEHTERALVEATWLELMYTRHRWGPGFSRNQSNACDSKPTVVKGAGDSVKGRWPGFDIYPRPIQAHQYCKIIGPPTSAHQAHQQLTNGSLYIHSAG